VTIRCEKVLKNKCPYDYINQVKYRKSWENLSFSLHGVLTLLTKLILSILRCPSILSAYLWLNLLISSLTYDTLKSWYNVSLMTYHGALTIILCYFFWNHCNISILELETIIFHNWTPYAQIALKIALYKITASLQPIILISCRITIFLSWSPSYFRLVNIYFFQFSLWSRRRYKYLASSTWEIFRPFRVTGGHISSRVVNVTFTYMYWFCPVSFNSPFF